MSSVPLKNKTIFCNKRAACSLAQSLFFIEKSDMGVKTQEKNILRLKQGMVIRDCL